MITLISPAKTLDYKNPAPSKKHSDAAMLSEAERLVQVMQKKSAKKIAALMSVNDQIAQLNYERYQKLVNTFQPRKCQTGALRFSRRCVPRFRSC